MADFDAQRPPNTITCPNHNYTMAIELFLQAAPRGYRISQVPKQIAIVHLKAPLNEILQTSLPRPKKDGISTLSACQIRMRLPLDQPVSQHYTTNLPGNARHLYQNRCGRKTGDHRLDMRQGVSVTATGMIYQPSANRPG